MEPLLFLAHRIPYPPDKGDKIRSYHLLRHLAEHYRVLLGAFVDDPEDWQHVGSLREWCDDLRVLPLSGFRGTARGLTGFLDGTPLSVRYFRDRRMASWVDRKLGELAVRRVLVYSSSMAQYVPEERSIPGARTVLDFVDVDSDKWRQYSQGKSWPMSAVYAREANALLRFERRAAARFDAGVFVSRAEAELFASLCPEARDRVTFVENGVDTTFFSPDRSYPDPYDGCRSVLVFTGAMDYWANVDAVSWFVDQVFPELIRRMPEARFYIVGSRPTEAVRRLGRRRGVVVTGRVPDVRPYLAHARAAVAPLRIARGIQNKVLEAMAMARPVIASSQAMDGLEIEGESPRVAGAAEEWVDAALRMLRDAPSGLGAGLRESVIRRFDWHCKVVRFRELLEGAPTGDASIGAAGTE